MGFFSNLFGKKQPNRQMESHKNDIDLDSDKHIATIDLDDISTATTADTDEYDFFTLENLKKRQAIDDIGIKYGMKLGILRCLAIFLKQLNFSVSLLVIDLPFIMGNIAIYPK